MTNLQEKLNEALVGVGKILDDNNIPFYLVGGNAIGAYREEKFLEWDDDVDLGIPEEYIDMALNLFKDHDRFTLKNFKEKFPYQSITKIYDKNAFIEDEGVISYIFIDIFTLFKKREISNRKYIKIKMWDYILSAKKTLNGRQINRNIWSFIPRYLWYILPIRRKTLLKKVKRNISNSKVTEENHNIRYIYELFWSKPIRIQIYSLEYEMKSFENNKYRVSKDLRKNLMGTLGDISIPPKISDRWNHGLKLYVPDDKRKDKKW